MNCKNGKIFSGRDMSVDIIKALGIIGMVAGHCGSPITKFIYLFHMAIFFIASGYCYTSEKSDSLESFFAFTKRKFRTLYFPYVLWTVIYSCLHNLFIKLNVYTDNILLLKYVDGEYIGITEPWTIIDIIKSIIRACLLHANTQMGGAFWFIATLMEISITYCFIDLLIKQILPLKVNDTIKIQLIISIVFLGLGYVCHLTQHSFAGISKILSYYILYYGGFLIKKYGVSSKDRIMYKHCIILVLSFAILFICNKLGEINLSSNSYENPAFFLIVSFAGWQFVYELAYFIKKSDQIKNIMVCIGQNTMAVVILHFLCFKIVSYVGVLLEGKPLCLVAAFPVLYRNGYWWIFYLAVGVSIPVFLSIARKRIMRCLKNTILHRNSKIIMKG